MKEPIAFSVFKKIQLEILKEAQFSPNLLTDLAGLEEYIAETYNKRSFIELLQNADDANASSFCINQINNDTIIVANNGRSFSEKDLISICRSASSFKNKNESIGYRGIGFKSVVSLAKNVCIISGDYRISFSKSSTALLVPLATRVPLIRIPHWADDSFLDRYKEIVYDLQSKGFSTFFIFSGLTEHAIEAEIKFFSSSSMLFLRHILSVEVIVNGNKIIKAHKTQIKHDNKELVEISNMESLSSWCLFHKYSNTIALRTEEKSVVKLNEVESLVSAFLPTEDLTGLGVLINGSFSTDPSRRHVIYDSLSITCIEEIADLFVSILTEALSHPTEENYAIINALVPYTDPHLYKFQNDSFGKFLITKVASSVKKIFANVLLAPSWLNIKDFELLTTNSKEFNINRSFYEIPGFVSFLKFLGAKEISLSSIIEMDLSCISNIGCIQIVKEIIRESIPSYVITNKSYLTLSVFSCDNVRRSLLDIKDQQFLLDVFFIQMLLDQTISIIELRTFFKLNSTIESLSNLDLLEKKSSQTNEDVDVNIASSEAGVVDKDELNDVINSWLSNLKTRKIQIQESSKWRSVEIQTKDVLNTIGFNLKDVSKQNIGYDLEGTAPNGTSIVIEVKSIDNPNSQFALTNNEFALAKEMQNDYYLALVRILGDSLEIMLISDPTNKLQMERQAVQWRWACLNYKYEPIIFNY